MRLPSVLAFLALQALACASARADEAVSAAISERASEPSGPLFSPEGPGEGRHRIGVGLQMEILPVTLVESEQREIPEIAAAFRYGLPKDFTLDARFHGIVIKNDADVGVSWCYRWDSVCLAPTLRQGLRFGSLSSGGFDASSWGFVTRPGISIGMPWRNLRFSFAEEFLFSHDQHLKIGDIQMVTKGNFNFEGISVTSAVETIFPGGGIFYFGFGLNWASNYDQAWVAFSDDRSSRGFFPRFLMGYAF